MGTDGPPGAGGSDSARSGADAFWQEFARARTERSRRGRRPEAAPPTEQAETGDHACVEWCPICRSADLLRAAGGPEVRGQLASLQRESLLALRMMIDAYLARSPEHPPQSAPPGGGLDEPPVPPVQDIPLD